MLAFAVAAFLLLITPGPGVLSAAGVGAGFGVRPGLIYVVGLCLGANLVAVMVVGGYGESSDDTCPVLLSTEWFDPATNR